MEFHHTKSESGDPGLSLLESLVFTDTPLLILPIAPTINPSVKLFLFFSFVPFDFTKKIFVWSFFPWHEFSSGLCI